MQKIICGHERQTKKPADNKKGHGEHQGHDDDQGHDKGDSHTVDSITVKPEISVSGDHHRSKRSPDSLTESLAQSFNFGKII